MEPPLPLTDPDSDRDSEHRARYDSEAEFERLFLLCIDLPPEDADRILEEQCTDPAIKSLVTRMLKHDRMDPDTSAHDAVAITSVMETADGDSGNEFNSSISDQRGDLNLVDEIGRGGMGVVYRAWDPILNRHVAVKVILAGNHATADEVALFEQEAKIMARLDHSNIVKLYEYRRCGAQSWFVMPLLSGVTLHSSLLNKPLEPELAARIIRDVAQAVAYAHANGVQHRDIKPANIFITADGTPVVTDFGIARIAFEKQSDYAQRRGTLGYCAPERLLGVNSNLSDIYSVGAVLYACLIGKPPHHSAGHEVFAQILSGKIISPKAINASIDDDLNTICMKCLEPEPSRRYDTAKALADDLQRFLSHEPIVARPRTLRYQFQLAYRRNPKTVATAAATAVAALLALVLAIGLSGFAIARVLQMRIDRSELHASSARAVRDNGGIGQRTTSLEHLRKAAKIHPPGADQFRALRNSMLESLCLTDLEVVHSIASAKPDLCALDEALSICACESDRGEIKIVNCQTSQEVCSPVPFEGTLVQLRLSDKGDYLGVVTATNNNAEFHQLHVVRIGEDAVRCLDARITGTAWQFLKDGSTIAYCQANGDLVEAALQGDKPPRTIAPNCWASDLSINHDTTLAALALQTAPFLKVVHWGNGALAPSPDHNAEVKAVAWSHDGSMLATATRNEVRLWEMPSGTLRENLKLHQAPVNAMAFNSDSCLLASHSWDGRSNIWDVRTGNRLIGFSGTSSMRFARDSSRFAGVRSAGDFAIAKLVGDDYSRLLYVPDSEKASDRTSPDRGVWSVDFMPGSTLLATSHLNGVSFFNSADSRTPLQTLAIGHCSSCGFLPNGQALITSGKSGLFYWPVRRAAHQPQTLEIGWPASLKRHPKLSGHRLSIGPNSDLLAILDQNRKELHVEYLLDPSRSHDFSLPSAIDAVCLNPDQTAVALGSWNHQPAGTWLASLNTGASEHQGITQLTDDDAWPCFQPNGDLLLSTLNGHRMLRPLASTFDELFDLDCPALTSRGIATYSHSGHWIAVNMDEASIRILNANNGTEVATLRTRDVGTVTCMAFARDQSQLAVGYQNRLVRVWNLNDMNRVLYQSRLNWHPFPAPTELAPITRVEMLDRTLSSHLSYPPAVSMVDKFPVTSPPDIQLASQSKPFHQNNIAYDQGIQLAKSDQWEEACEQFTKAVDQSPEVAKHWYAYALIQLKLGNTSQYRRACQEMVNRFASSKDNGDKKLTTWTCALADNSVTDWEPVMTMADSLVAIATFDPKGHTHRNTRGLLYLRMQRYFEARDELEVAMRIHTAGGNPSDWLALAIVLDELGDTDQAQRLYRRANTWIEEQVKRDANARASWHELLEYKLLREQAQARLEVPSN